MRNSVEQHAGLTQESASELLKRRGYEMVCPFEHVHATDGHRHSSYHSPQAARIQDKKRSESGLLQGREYNKRRHGGGKRRHYYIRARRVIAAI